MNIQWSDQIYLINNTRLQQIFQSNEIFGGKSVILFGDLAQLPPVGDSWIFQPNFSQLY